MSDIFGMAELETIEKLADIIREKELSEVTITDGGKTITIKGKKCPPPPPPAMPFPPMQAAGMPMPQAPPMMPQQQSPAPAAPAQEAVSGKVVKSPIVGTYYAAPSPEKPAFVKVGDKVSKGDVIMIIESMKLMNEIQSDFDGIVDKILVSDGQAVEFDQPLMIIK